MYVMDSNSPFYEEWLARVADKNEDSFRITYDLRADGLMLETTVQPGDAYIHRESGIILAFTYANILNRREFVALNHADSKQAARKELRDARDLRLDIISIARAMAAKTPLGLFLVGGAYVGRKALRHVMGWDDSPPDPGYYSGGKMYFKGVLSLS